MWRSTPASMRWPPNRWSTTSHRTSRARPLPPRDQTRVRTILRRHRWDAADRSRALGARINRALGLGLRKRFCQTFDFELQAAASNDAVLLSLGPQHSFPLEEVPAYLRLARRARDPFQAVLRSRCSPPAGVEPKPLPRRSRDRGGKDPPAIQRMEADDLMAAVFPALAACQENASRADRGSRTTRSCVRRSTTAARGDGPRRTEGVGRGGARRGPSPSLRRHRRALGALTRDLERRAPTPSSTTRRSGSVAPARVPLRRGLPVEPREAAGLDPAAIERVRECAKCQ